ncbi:MAG: winged helix-turn-helix transcriptional regulator [Elusimicrobia bacterium]|nr:winged helix-turn-helix transcriptional regulator [Elusimicrobiota bacterium]
MKTETRARIVKIIQESACARPIELVKILGLSPQAIHRHLRVLADSGILEPRGRGPMRRYFLAGAPQLSAALSWYASIAGPAETPEEFVCETRDVFTARLGRLSSFTRMGLKEDELPLAISVTGEVGNNSFDHNLGNWRDVPGCWFETQATGGWLWICVADRGQGVFRSLTRADPTIPNEPAALVAAFERTLSGRAPENRGNGLKFVRNIVVASAGRGLACRSGAGLVEYGRLGSVCRKELARFPAEPAGTVTLILWSLK